MSYRNALQYLSELERMGMELGLEKTKSLLDALGNPHRSYPALLIGGTNGKSSVASIIANIFQQAGLRVGLYTSPHILVPEERIQVDGHPIPRMALASAVRELQEVVDELCSRNAIQSKPTYFELLTVLAAWYFQQLRAQFGVFEVGLGGRYDATNVADPVVSVITSIDYDHTEVLGETLTEIAEEKLGITRTLIPLVFNVPRLEAREAVGRYCHRHDIPMVDARIKSQMVKREEGWWLRTERSEYQGIQPLLHGAHQLENIATATLAMEAISQHLPDSLPLSTEEVVQGINSTQLAGRLERMHEDPEVLLDGAHNPAAAFALAQFLRSERLTPVLLFSALGDKDIEGVARELFPLASHVIITRIPGSPRAETPHRIRERTAGIRADSVIIDDPEEALEHALAACGRRGHLVVTGSFYLVGIIRRLLREER